MEGPLSNGRLFLVRSSDWAVRTFEPPEGKWFAAYALTERFLFLAYQGTGAAYGKATSLYRFDLSKFEEVGSPLD